MKKEKYYKDNKLNVGAIVTACVLFSLAVGFVLYSHVKYILDKKEPAIPVEPVKTYSEISEEEGLDRLRLISNDFKDSFETEGKPIDVSFTYKMQVTEDYATTTLEGYLIRKDSTLENNYYLSGTGNGEFEEMYYFNKGLSTYAIERGKDKASSPWEITKYEVVDWSSKEEAYEKVGSGSLGYVLLLVLSAGPGLTNTAESILEARVENEFISEKFESTGDLGNLRYTYAAEDEGETQNYSLIWNNYRLVHFESVSKEGNESPATASYDFEWTDDIERKPIPANR